jgi:hypothetical protein
MRRKSSKSKRVSAIARKRVGRIPAPKVITPKTRRDPKHRKQETDADLRE